jgi:hypothetical protein
MAAHSFPVTKNFIDLYQSRSQRLVLALLAAIILFTHIKLSEYAFDDAFIHFRVARNFLDTGVPYFNQAEAIKVSTSSAWTIFLTIILFLEHAFVSETNIPLIVGILNALFTFLGMLLYTKIISRVLGYTPTPHVGTIYQISYFALIAPSSIGLMETPLAILIAGIGIYLLTFNRREAFIILALAAYIRIELIVLIIFGAGLLLHQKKIKISEIFLFVTMGLAPFIAFDLLFFHTVVPQSIIAKSIVYSISSVEVLGQIIFFSLPLHSLIINNLTAFIVSLCLFAGLLITSSKTAFNLWLLNGKIYLFLFLAWSISIIGIYIWRHVLVFEWYMPLYTIPLLTAAAISVNTLKTSQRTLSSILYYSFSLICFYSAGQTLFASMASPVNFGLFESGSRVKTYRAVAKIINSEYPDSRLLSSEIGGLGYEFKGTILDAAGLASPEALAFHPLKVPEERERGNLGVIPLEYVEVKLPEIIVSYDEFGMNLINSKISEEYMVITIPAYLTEDRRFSKTNMIWGSKYLRVYIRKDLPVSEEILDMAKK